MTSLKQIPTWDKIVIFLLTVCHLSVCHLHFVSGWFYTRIRIRIFFYCSIKHNQFSISPECSASDLDSILCCSEQQVAAEGEAVAEKQVTCVTAAGQKGTSQMWNMSFCSNFHTEDTRSQAKPSCDTEATRTTLRGATMLEVFGLTICCLQPCNFCAGSLSLLTPWWGLRPTSLPKDHIVPTIASVKKTSSMLVWLDSLPGTRGEQPS